MRHCCSIATACQATSLGRTSLYKHVRLGEITTIKAGRRTLVLTDSIDAFIERQIALSKGRG